MDRRIEDRLEEFLRGSLDQRRRAEFEQTLQASDEETRRMVGDFERHSRLIREAFIPAEGPEPAPGFYARVLDRIESQRKTSFWAPLLEPLFFRRLVFASAALLVLLAVATFTTPPEEDLLATNPGILADYVMAQEPPPVDVVMGGDQEQSRDHILVNLATYQE